MKLDQVLRSFPATLALWEPPGGPMTPALSSNPGSATEYVITNRFVIQAWLRLLYTMYIACTCLIICWGISVASWNIFCTLGFFWLANKPGDMVLHVFAKYIIKICSKGHIERKYLMKSYLLLLKSCTNFKI